MLHYNYFSHNVYDIKINAKYKFNGKKNNQVQFYSLYNYVHVIFINYSVQISVGHYSNKSIFEWKKKFLFIYSKNMN